MPGQDAAEQQFSSNPSGLQREAKAQLEILSGSMWEQEISNVYNRNCFDVASWKFNPGVNGCRSYCTR